MNIGMLWFDNDPKTPLETKVEKAAGYYHTKYGHSPNMCYVHPTMLPATAGDETKNRRITPTGVELRSHRAVLPNHFWIGREAPVSVERSQA